MAGNITSIAFFNFSGISIMKELNATTRMVLDSCRTIVIWVVSLSVAWQGFTYQSFLLQSFGFILLIGGTLVYNNVVIAPFLEKHNCLRPSEEDEDSLTQSQPGIFIIFCECFKVLSPLLSVSFSYFHFPVTCICVPYSTS